MARTAIKKNSPAILRDYFEALTRAVFRMGTSPGVVEARWGGLTAAFEGFDPARVALFTSQRIDGLMHEARMVRNRRKIEATVDNAVEMVAIDRAHRGFDNYLRSHSGTDELVADLTSRFACLGDEGAMFFLKAVSEY
jgi:3-methyladenine DNA glycosylase Tag